MTLDEAFLKYEDHQKMRRSSIPYNPDSNSRIPGLPIYFLKNLKSSAVKEESLLDFALPQDMIDFCNAGDWELVDEHLKDNMDKFEFTVDRSLSAEGTLLLGYIFFSYDVLVKVFGLPGEPGDNYKSDAEWRIKLKSGEVLCIYDYKSGKNYCGEGGLDVKDIKEWHVGGKNKSDYLKLIEILNREYYELL